VLAHLVRWMEKHEYESINQTRGSMSQRSVEDPAAFERETTCGCSVPTRCKRRVEGSQRRVTGITACDLSGVSSSLKPEEVGMGQSEKKRVLIVDNDEEESRKLEGMLQQEGYDSSTTWSGL